MRKKDLNKNLVAFKYEKKFDKCVTFFKGLICDPEKEIEKFLPLYELVLIYNRCFVHSFAIKFSQFLTENEIEALDFNAFEKVFQNRVILEDYPKLQHSSLSRLVDQKEVVSYLFVIDIFSALNSHNFKDFVITSAEKKRSKREILDDLYFDILKSGNYELLKKQLNSFELKYNDCLKETMNLWYARKSMIRTFFTLKDKPRLRFYFLISILFLDQNLSLSLNSLSSLHFHFTDIRERVLSFTYQEERQVSNSQTALDFEKFLDLFNKWYD